MHAPPDTERLQLVFTGEIVEGHDPQAVRAAVKSALQLDEARAARLFSGRRVVLRRAVDVRRAHRTIARFAMLGAVVRAEAPAPAPATAPPPTAAPPPAATTPGLAEAMAAATAAAAAPLPPPPAAAATAVPWRRAGRWLGLAVAGSLGAVVLGLLLGPGLGMLWSETPPPAADLPPLPREADLPAPPWPAAGPDPAEAPQDPASPDPDALSPAVADADLPADMTPEAVRDYRQQYLPARDHKAFALSSSRLHAWQAGAASTDAAREAALARCMAALRPGDDGCRIVDADGELLE